MDELRAITTFVRAAEHGSFNKAALAQGTTPQAVSKSIRQLEGHLGVRLFHRTTRKNSLTHEGERLFGEVRANLEAMTAALGRARSAMRDEEGLIRISAGSSAGRKVVMPLLAEFVTNHSGVEFDLVFEDRATDTVTERIDVGFRAGNAFQPMSPFLCCSDPEAEMQAVIDGLGVGQIDSINAAKPIREGALVPLLTRHVSDRMGFYIYYAQRRNMPARVRRFIEFAVEKLKDSQQFHLQLSELRAAR